MISTTAHAESKGPGLGSRMKAFFSAEGALSRSRDFEFRPQQQQMASLVGEALEKSVPLIVEAGTGVGKSLAYLIPALIYAVENRKKAIISTHTINLQEQLVRKDIPLAIRSLGIEVKAVLLKGRGNYLCPRRLKTAMGQTGELFSSSEEAQLRAIWDWSQKTDDGSLGDLPFTPDPRVWAQVRSEPFLCSKRLCKGSLCFYQELRRRVDEADVVVMNHTLFFTLLAGQEEMPTENSKGFLFPNDFVVFDEAHTLENIAARQLGLNLSHAAACFDLRRLFHPKTSKGIFQVLRNASGAQAVVEVIEELGFFFHRIESECRFNNNRRVLRLREPEFVSDSVSESLIRLESSVAQTADRLEDENTKLELEDLGRKVRDLRLSIHFFLEQTMKNHVYWVEKVGTYEESVTLNAAPLDIAARFAQLFFQSAKPVIMTSATLGIKPADLSYFKNRIGAGEVYGKQIGSPFDYERQMTLYLVKSMPEPTSKQFEAALERWIAHFVKLSQGRAFVLFTSYRLMQQMAGKMQRFFSQNGWQLLVQGAGKARSQLIHEFKEDISSVLFGTDSFWTGVDVPGEALSNVIITRLPFAVPDHPLTASRLEKIEETGRNPFHEYSVPEAVLKLRQGVGRLIRSSQDRGIAVILDNRVVTRQYGKIFLEALPKTNIEIVS